MVTNEYTYMRKENVCEFLTFEKDGHLVQCPVDCECPKSRSRWIVTTACWRVKNDNR
jgi:hypothetical protein